jgi:Uma2 family endonuclease
MTAILEATTANGAIQAEDAPRVVASGVTWDEFLRIDDGRHLEWVDGEVIEQPMPSSEHQRIFGFLFRLFCEYAEQRDLGEVFSDPFLMYVLPGSRGRAPDIAFVAKENLSRVQRNSIHGPADLVVEIASSSTGHVDRGGKFQEYQRGGVREYWLLDPDTRTASFYQLANDVYEEIAPPSGIYTSSILSGLWLRVDWLWQRPPLADVRRELGLI